MTKAKSTYDPSKDVVIEELGALGDSGLFAAIRQYNGNTDRDGDLIVGEKKLSVWRVVGKNKDRIKQLFRLPLDEVVAIRDFLVSLPIVVGDNDEEEFAGMDAEVDDERGY